MSGLVLNKNEKAFDDQVDFIFATFYHHLPTKVTIPHLRQGVELLPRKVWQVSCRYLFSFGDILGNGMAAFRPPPPQWGAG